MNVVHVRVRGSGTLAEFLCGAHSYSDLRKALSLAVPQRKDDITCPSCRRLYKP